MRIGSLVKAVSLATGTYRMARFAERHFVDRQRLATFRTEVALYRSLIPAGALCFDVGANIGARTEALLEAGARVVAFEPQLACAREITARCKSYTGLHLVPAALGEAPSIATLFMRSSHGQSGFVEAWEGTTVRSIDVPVLTLDLAIARYGTPYYCKIDVEGYELQVLSGLTQAIPMVSIEYHLTGDDIVKTQRCVKLLRHFGLRYANVCPAEVPILGLPAWRPIEEFDAWFPAALDGRKGYRYGDLLFAIDEPRHGAMEVPFERAGALVISDRLFEKRDRS